MTETRSATREMADILGESSPRGGWDLRSALAEADIRVLLMVLFHMTGDERWLAAPYRPKRDIRLIPDPDAGLSDEVQQEIRDAVLALYVEGTPEPVVSRPDVDLLLRMMSTSLGEAVPSEYGPLMLEEMGFVGRHEEWAERPAAEVLARRHVLIVGAGVCALALGVSLGKLGIPYTIVEKNAEIGGTWYVNRYPGCGVDTPNHSYSYSFSGTHDWTSYFVKREELLGYLLRIADEHGIREHVRLRTELIASRWDEARTCWVSTLRTPEGDETFDSAILVSAIGQLNDPQRARFAGEEEFSGTILHSALWPEGLDLSGKHVAVIGTGATSMQLVPAIADKVASVSVYQRSPQWARPVKGYADPISDGARWLLLHLPFYRQWYRFNMFWRYGDSLLPFLRKDPSWPHPERAVNRINDRHRQEMTDFILAELEGRPDLVEKCLPTYPPYGKRILLDAGWFQALRRPNVELVTEPVARFDREGVVTADGKTREADVIVVATGFKVTEMAARLNITGQGGVRLADEWAGDDPTAYLGLTVPHFPNFFCMMGPNTGPGHGGSIIFQSECQSRYISACIARMIKEDIAAIDVRREVKDDYVRRVDEEHETLIWTHPGMTTYYRNAKGRVFSAMPWRFVDYWVMTHDPDLNDYHLTRPAA